MAPKRERYGHPGFLKVDREFTNYLDNKYERASPFPSPEPDYSLAFDSDGFSTEDEDSTAKEWRLPLRTSRKKNRSTPRERTTSSPLPQPVPSSQPAPPSTDPNHCCESFQRSYELLQQRVAILEAENNTLQASLQHLTHDMAILKRLHPRDFQPRQDGFKEPSGKSFS